MVYKNILESELPVKVACETLEVSRTGYKNWMEREPSTPYPDEAAIELEIRKIAKEFVRYGYRKTYHELKRRKIRVGKNKVHKMMKKLGLLCKKRKYRICTTNSNHKLRVYPNLAKGLELLAPNQLWVSDITYVELGKGHVYLSVVLDAFTKKCLGWQLSRKIDAQLCVDALEMAIRERTGTNFSEIIHHSDQGVQYASNEYISLLEIHGFKISMSRRGNPYDNAYAESFMKTLKYEAVYLTEYETFEDAYADIQNFLEEVYNRKRIHSSIGYVTPQEFENQWNLKKVRA